MAKHPKTDSERQRDNRRLKQVALLWWSRKIYELADQACEATGAYEYCTESSAKDVGTCNSNYKMVVNQLVTAAEELNKLRGKRAQKLEYRLILEDQMPRSSSNCSSDSDCPDDYICVEGTCESLFPLS